MLCYGKVFYKERMWRAKDIYYVSDSTGILAETFGRALICHFPEISFCEETFPFVRTKREAEKAFKKILHQSIGLQPVIFSTIMDAEVREIFNSPEVEFFDGLSSLLDRFEECLETKALRGAGFSHKPSDQVMERRVEAIHYCLAHDDGTNPTDYKHADVIILGVSRAGKTPVSVYLATQMGIKTANFPLTDDHIVSGKIPPYIITNKKKAIALSPNAETLHYIREKRLPNSKYASLATCRHEIQQSHQMYLKYNIPYIASSRKSIEEIATQIIQQLNLTRK